MDEVPGGGATPVVARLDAASAPAKADAELDLVLDTSQVKLFDPNGGASLRT